MTYSRDDVEVRQITPLYQGAYRADRYHLRFRRFNNCWSQEVNREVFDRGHAVAVLPYDPENDEVVVLEQFRAGPFAAGDQPWMLEIVAGAIETGETPEEVAHRECVEETGLTPIFLTKIAGYYTSAGSVSEFLHLFAARVVTRNVGGVHGIVSEGEDIRVQAIASESLFAELDAQRIRTGPAVAALNWLRVHRKQLRSAWKS